MLLLLSTTLLITLTVFSTATALPNLPPYGHRVYTYQPTPSGIISSFNQLTDPFHNASVSVVNAYGGWFSKSMPQISVRCTNTETPTPPSPRRFVVNNTEVHPISILACAADGCKHADYVHCSGGVPAKGSAVVTIDANIHFLLMVYNNTFTQECWPKTYGTFPNLQLPLTPQACAQLPSGANPSLPTPADAVVHLEPAWTGHATSKPSSNIDAFAQVEGVEHITLVLDGRMDLCEEYDQYNMSNRNLYPCDGSPDLRHITPENMDNLAAEVAKVACENDVVTGVQIDLEPLSKQWRGSAIDAMGRMAKALVESPGCKTSKYPNGRHISTFAFAENVDDALLEALGSNGYLAISGYDVSFFSYILEI